MADKQMGMPCTINSILKLTPAQGYPTQICVGDRHTASKSGYRIIPMDVPIPLVDEQWVAHADIVITKLKWEQQHTVMTYRIHRLYPEPFLTKA